MLALLAAQALNAQEIRGLARIDSRGDAVWGANITLFDSLGREAATTKTNRKGEFAVSAPLPGTYFLSLSARSVGRMSSPVFVLDSGATIFYEHTFRQTVEAQLRGEEFSAQTLLPVVFRDSTAGRIERGTSGVPITQVRVTVLGTQGEVPIANTELALVPIDSRAEPALANKTAENGTAVWRGIKPTWYRVVGRHIGFSPGGTTSFPIMGEADSVHVVLRLSSVVLLDPVKVMEQRITQFGFNVNLMRRFFLGGDALKERNPSPRSIDDLVISLNIPGLGVKSGNLRSSMAYRGQRVRVFILDGSRTNGDLPEVEPTAVESLMFIPPNEAGAIFGPDAIGGVLIINTRRR
jgi:hypothetical protein